MERDIPDLSTTPGWVCRPLDMNWLIIDVWGPVRHYQVSFWCLQDDQSLKLTSVGHVSRSGCCCHLFSIHFVQPHINQVIPIQLEERIMTSTGRFAMCHYYTTVNPEIVPFAAYT